MFVEKSLTLPEILRKIIRTTRPTAFSCCLTCLFRNKERFWNNWRRFEITGRMLLMFSEECQGTECFFCKSLLDGQAEVKNNLVGTENLKLISHVVYIC